MNHAALGFLVIAVPIAALLFSLVALGVVSLRKPPGRDPPETAPKVRRSSRPRPEPPGLSEREKRRAERRAKRRNL